MKKLFIFLIFFFITESIFACSFVCLPGKNCNPIELEGDIRFLSNFRGYTEESLQNYNPILLIKNPQDTCGGTVFLTIHKELTLYVYFIVILFLFFLISYVSYRYPLSFLVYIALFSFYYLVIQRYLLTFHGGLILILYKALSLFIQFYLVAIGCALFSGITILVMRLFKKDLFIKYQIAYNFLLYCICFFIIGVTIIFYSKELFYSHITIASLPFLFLMHIVFFYLSALVISFTLKHRKILQGNNIMTESNTVNKEI